MMVVKIPLPIAAVVAGKAITFRFQLWLDDLITNDIRVGVTAKALLTAADIKQELKDSVRDPEQTVLKMSDAHYEFLKPIVEAPSGGYNPAVGLQLISFIRAFQAAELATD